MRDPTLGWSLVSLREDTPPSRSSLRLIVGEEIVNKGGLVEIERSKVGYHAEGGRREKKLPRNTKLTVC